MIGGEAPTPLDLRFRLGPFPVRVSVMFWVIMALLGYGWAQDAPENTWVNLLIWVACGFVSILVHELGHAAAYRAFGSWSAITLYGFGGYAQANEAPPQAWQRMVVALAGPAAGFVLFGFVALFRTLTLGVALHPYAVNAIAFLFWMNVIWGLFNLLPIRPLDGGNVCRELAALVGLRAPDVVSHAIGFVLAALLALAGGLRIAHLKQIDDLMPGWWFYVPASIFLTLWFALLAVDNFQRMQIARQRVSYYQPPDDDDYDTPPWRRR